MITWMQRHKKYLIITIWISTIAFVGAGFVGWGQYSYGDKAGAVAKVGDIEITMGELQKSYSNLYSQYSEMFKGDFDEEKAKAFGLKSQALNHLTQQALILNLAKSYDLRINDDELLAEIKSQKYFLEDGVFNKEIYKQTLLRNNLSLKDYEASVKKELLIKKTLSLLPIDVKESELKILDTAANIADKIEYKVLNPRLINIDTSDKFVKPFWEARQHSFMTEISYDVKYIKQPKITKEYDETELSKYYSNNKTHFKDSEGKILALESAKDKIKEELNAKETKKEALRLYIAYKKGKLQNNDIQTSTISASYNPFTSDVISKISKLTTISPFLKPVLVNGEYFTFELIKTNPSQPKSFADAKNEVTAIYIQEQKKTKLLDLAKSSVGAFRGETTNFITGNNIDQLTELSTTDAKEFVTKLFTTQKKRGFISLENGNIVMYNILEQKLLTNTNANPNNSIVKLKSAMFNEGLVKKLQNKYKTEIFVQGL
ncbi:MAG: SurA N-terminal domain-containing protein [Sulfurimonas sp.]|nr:SurA N-terminal domain-containing protein [Sulfurimonas sp.]